MKSLLLLFALSCIAACGEPIRVTGNPDDRSATSGTLGGAKAENQLPVQDTVRADTTMRKN